MDEIEQIKQMLEDGAEEPKLTKEGHRSRVKTAVDKDPDFTTFSDHEILEYLLFSTFAQKDTKEISRELINTFGSFSAVLRATPHELMRVAEIGEKTARMLSSIIPASRRAEESRMRNQVFIPDPKNAAKYLAPMFDGLTKECIYMVSIDTNDRAIQTDLIAVGRVGEVTMDIMKMTAYASRNGAAKILMAHNHPAGSLIPSSSDVEVTCRMVMACSLMNVVFVDHLIFAGNNFFSFLGNRLMETVYQNCDSVLGTNHASEFRQRKKAGLDTKYLKEAENWLSMSYAQQMETLASLYALCDIYEQQHDNAEEILDKFIHGIVNLPETTED